MRLSTVIVLVTILAAFLLVMGCGQDEPTTSSRPDPTPIPPSSSQSTSVPNESGDNAVPNSPVGPIILEVITPEDESMLEVGFVRVMGKTSATSVSIDGAPTVVDQEGYFQNDIALNSGENLIKVVASSDQGGTASQSIKVTVTEELEGLPFTVLYPQDGFESSARRVTLVGVTTPDAVVAVNGSPIDVNGVGIFSTTVELEPGGNLLEVLGADFQGNYRFSDVSVFVLD